MTSNYKLVRGAAKRHTIAAECIKTAPVRGAAAKTGVHPEVNIILFLLSTALGLISGVTAKKSFQKAAWNRNLLIQDPLMLKRQNMIVDKNIALPILVNEK